MNKTRVLFVVALIICVILAFLIFWQLMANSKVDPVTDPDSPAIPLLAVHWIGIVKSLSILLAGIALLWQGFFGTILRTVKLPVLFSGLGILFIAAGYIQSFILRVFNATGQLSSATLFETIMYAVGGLMIAGAIFSFPNTLKAKLKRSQQIWFAIGMAIGIGIFAFIILKYFEIILSNIGSLVSSIGFPILTLITYSAALRCTMIFSGGRIGRPFLFISVGALTLLLFNFLVWMPIDAVQSIWFLFGEYGLVHIFFVFSFLITAIGAYDLTLDDSVV